MLVSKTILAGFVVFSLTATMLHAQSLRRNRGPAEIPPASFTANQYIDSKGCVFIRSGYGGRVTWVPRVTRSRRVVCGQTPSRVAGATTAPTRRTQQPAPLVLAAATPQTTTTANPRRRIQSNFWRNFWGTGQGTARRTATTRPANAPTATVFTRRKRNPGRVATATRPAQVPTTVAGVIQFNLQGGYQVREGPQAIHPAVYAVNRPLGAAPVVMINGVTQSAPAPLPGYRSLIADNRTVSGRGVGTAQGQAAMDLIWTDSVPRKLVDVTTGIDVSGKFPNIRYPYTTVITKGFRTAALAAPAKSAAGVAPLVLTKSTRQVEFVAALAGPVMDDGVTKTLVPSRLRYVQVATFGVPANAVRTLAKFSATGLPTHSRPLHRKGKVYEIVLLGPFLDAADLKTALSAARRAGFGDAYFVK